MSERRRGRRLRGPFDALFVRELGGSDIGMGVVRDVSTTGICIVTDEPPEPDAQLYVGLFLADRDDPLIARARVVRVEAEASRGYAVGLALWQTGAAQHHAIMRLADYLARRRDALASPEAASR